MFRLLVVAAEISISQTFQPSSQKYRLLKSGHSSREIAAATRDAMRVRKQRAETIRDLRSAMQTLAIEEQASKAIDLTTTTPTSTICPAPVTTSPLRSTTGRSRWVTCRHDQPLQMRRRQRRLSQTRSPMPLKIHTTNEIGRNSKSLSPVGRPVLSPLRTNTRLSSKPQQSPKVMSPNRRLVHSPLPTPRQQEEQGRSPFFCHSPTIASMGSRRVSNDENQQNSSCNNSNNSNERGKLTPTKRPLTPVKKSTTTPSDKPMSMPKRLRTPPPPSRIRASRMF